MERLEVCFVLSEKGALQGGEVYGEDLLVGETFHMHCLFLRCRIIRVPGSVSASARFGNRRRQGTSESDMLVLHLPVEAISFADG